MSINKVELCGQIITAIGGKYYQEGRPYYNYIVSVNGDSGFLKHYPILISEECKPDTTIKLSGRMIQKKEIYTTPSSRIHILADNYEIVPRDSSHICRIDLGGRISKLYEPQKDVRTGETVRFLSVEYDIHKPALMCNTYGRSSKKLVRNDIIRAEVVLMGRLLQKENCSYEYTQKGLRLKNISVIDRAKRQEP